MPIFDVTTKITGTAFGQVIAETAEMAKDMFDQGEIEMTIEDWDIETQPHRGGYVDIAESNQSVTDENPLCDDCDTRIGREGCACPTEPKQEDT